MVCTKEYDPLGRVRSIRSYTPQGTVNAFDYGYDAVGNVLQVLERYPLGGDLPDREVRNTYDHVYRLTEEFLDAGACRCRVLQYHL